MYYVDISMCDQWGVKVHSVESSIEMAEQQVLDDSTLKKTRKSYSREEKLKVVKYYHENGKNL